MAATIVYHDTLITVIYTEIAYPVEINCNYYRRLPETSLYDDILSNLNSTQAASPVKKAVCGGKCNLVHSLCHYNQWCTTILSDKLVTTSQAYFHISKISGCRDLNKAQCTRSGKPSIPLWLDKTSKSTNKGNTTMST